MFSAWRNRKALLSLWTARPFFYAHVFYKKGKGDTVKQSKRLISGVLCLAMAASLLPAPAALAAPRAASPASATGTIEAKVQMDLPISEAKFAASEAKVTVKQGGETIASADLTKNGTFTVNGESGQAQGTVALTVADGKVKQVDVAAKGLSADTGSNSYTLHFSGAGFRDYTSEALVLDNYSKGLVLGTGSASFTYGDVNGDKDVNDGDVEAMEAALAAADGSKDMNGDGVLDASDLALVVQAAAATGGAEVKNTSIIAAKTIQFDEMEKELNALDDKQSVVSGDYTNLFSDNPEETVTLTALKGNEIALPVPVEAGTEVSQVTITSSTAAPADQGSVVVTTEDDQELVYSFDESAPDGVFAIQTLDDGRKVVTIDLGKKVPVKKITIKVEVKDKQEIVLEQIEFLQDIVPDELPPVNTSVENVQAKAGDGSVTLTWNAYPNITGYRVVYGTAENALTQTMDVSTEKATIDNLENYTTYYFTVTPVAGDWSGSPSAIVSARPQSSQKPDKPDNVATTAGDGFLQVTWKPGKNTVKSRLEYRERDTETWKKVDGFYQTSATIGGLTNGTTYEVKVIGINGVGESNPSAIVLGTPKAAESAGPTLPEAGRIYAEKVAFADNTASNIGVYSRGELPQAVMDGDVNTGFVANTWSKSRAFTYTFSEPHEMNYVIYVPDQREDPSKPGKRFRDYFSNFEVTAVTDTGETVKLTPQVNWSKANNNEYFIVKFPKTNVKQLTIQGNQWGGAGNISLAEIAFYEYDPVEDQITKLFKDKAFTELASGVDETDIAAAEQALKERESYQLYPDVLKQEIILARKLLAGESMGLVKADFQSRSASVDANNYDQSASDLQPLGVVASAGATLTVYADVPDDADVKLVPSQYYGETSAWKGTGVTLKDGRNVIPVEKIGSLSDTRGGMLYVTYAGEQQEKIKLHVLEKDNQVVIAPTLELSDWDSLNEGARKEKITAYVNDLQTYVTKRGLTNTDSKTNIFNATEIATPSVLLSLPASQVLKGLGSGGTTAMADTLYNSLEAWNELLFLANKTQGITNVDTSYDAYTYPMQTRQNIRYSRMFSGAFMFAAGTYVGIDWNETPGMVSGQPLAATGDNGNGLFGWGIAHEVGHNMDKIGYAEITNNIYSLVAQTADADGNMTGKSRLEQEGRYTAIFNKVAQAKPGQAGDVFTQLGMYWQLHLAYDKGGNVMNGSGPLDFYNTFFKAYKSGEYKGADIAKTTDEKIALAAADVPDKDLTEFFTRWGMELSDGVKDVLKAYDKEEREIWYLNDDSRRARLNGESKANVGVDLKAEVQPAAEGEGASVTLTILTSEEADKLQGYEILRDGKAIGFLEADGKASQTYTDTLGAANNRAVSYSVRAIDKLGNVADTAEANEVRVSFDKTIASDAYTTSRDGTDVVITATGDAMTTSGLKLTGDSIPANGDYTVYISGDANADTANLESDDWMIAKHGDFGDMLEADSGKLAYFTILGAEKDDTRIGLYDAKKIVIRGVPESVDVNAIQLLSYPGDNIAFSDGAAIGVLGEDYTYETTDGKETIPKGTIVITGTYRGNPLYNSVRIKGTFQSQTPASSEAPTTEERTLSGETYLFAEVYSDKISSDTSDGFFLFVPDDQDLFKQVNDDTAENGTSLGNAILTDIRAEMWRAVDTSGSNARLTSNTMRISVPSFASMPEIKLT